LSRRGFVTIEILIAMVIGFLAIIMLFASVKSLQKITLQQRLYEDLYTTVLSLSDTIKAQECRKNPTLEGRLNGFDYTVACEQKKVMKNFQESYDETTYEDTGGNFGIFMIYLFEVTIEVRQGGLKKSYRFYQSEQERLVSEEELMNEMLQNM